MNDAQPHSGHSNTKNTPDLKAGGVVLQETARGRLPFHLLAALVCGKDGVDNVPTHC